MDEVAEKVLQAGGEVVLDAARAKLEGVIGRDTKYPSRATGTLADSLGLSPVKPGRDGSHDIKVGFAEGRADGKSNALLANVLEYGKSNQPAKPFMKPAKRASKKQAIAAMQDALEREADG